MAQISRDSFARTTLTRQIITPSATRTCDWCGNTRPNGTLFCYTTESDGGRNNTHKGLFCSKPCHDSYHN